MLETTTYWLLKGVSHRDHFSLIERLCQLDQAKIARHRLLPMGRMSAD